MSISPLRARASTRFDSFDDRKIRRDQRANECEKAATGSQEKSKGVLRTIKKICKKLFAKLKSKSDEKLHRYDRLTEEEVQRSGKQQRKR